MTDKWKRVSAEEFKILSRYHPSETRHYINFGVTGRVTTKIRKDIGKPQGPRNQKIALGIGRVESSPGSVRERVQISLKKIFKADLKAGLERNKLLASIMNDTGLKKQQVQPQISYLLEHKALRVVSEK
jgi:hypothetical protein